MRILLHCCDSPQAHKIVKVYWNVFHDIAIYSSDDDFSKFFYQFVNESVNKRVDKPNYLQLDQKRDSFLKMSRDESDPRISDWSAFWGKEVLWSWGLIRAESLLLRHSTRQSEKIRFNLPSKFIKNWNKLVVSCIKIKERSRNVQ